MIHFYWACGGRYGFDASLPADKSEKKLFIPGFLESSMVGVGLLVFGLFYMMKAGYQPFQMPEVVFKYVGWIIPSIFIIRAIGDFKYVGLFKRIKSTTFAKMDTNFFSPLCVFLGLAGMYVQYFV